MFKRITYSLLKNIVGCKYLHSNDGVYKEKHSNQEADIRKSLQKKT